MDAVLISVFALAVLVLLLSTRTSSSMTKEGYVTYIVQGPGWGGAQYPWMRRRFHPWRRQYAHF